VEGRAMIRMTAKQYAKLKGGASCRERRPMTTLSPTSRAAPSEAWAVRESSSDIAPLCHRCGRKHGSKGGPASGHWLTPGRAGELWECMHCWAARETVEETRRRIRVEYGEDGLPERMVLR
jgi:hypothetical protein